MLVYTPTQFWPCMFGPWGRILLPSGASFGWPAWE